MTLEAGIIPEDVIPGDRQGIPEAIAQVNLLGRRAPREAIDLVNRTVANGEEIVAAALSDEAGL
jgi:hypothetical protein